MNATIFGSHKDEEYMNTALVYAHKALQKGEIPVGAVLVDPNGAIIARSCNAVEQKQTQLAHAEARVIACANKKLGNWRLTDCWLYVTLEPCVMCMGLIMLSRVKGVVFGADSPLYGFHLDSQLSCQVYKSSMPIIVSGIKAQESAAVLKQFFKEKRKSGSSAYQKRS